MKNPAQRSYCFHSFSVLEFVAVSVTNILLHVMKKPFMLTDVKSLTTESRVKQPDLKYFRSLNTYFIFQLQVCSEFRACGFM